MRHLNIFILTTMIGFFAGVAYADLNKSNLGISKWNGDTTLKGFSNSDTEKFKNTFNHLDVGSGKSYQLKTFVNNLKSKLGSSSKIIFNKIDKGDSFKNKSSVANSKELIDAGWSPESDLDKIIDSIL